MPTGNDDQVFSAENIRRMQDTLNQMQSTRFNEQFPRAYGEYTPQQSQEMWQRLRGSSSTDYNAKPIQMFPVECAKLLEEVLEF